LDSQKLYYFRPEVTIIIGSNYFSYCNFIHYRTSQNTISKTLIMNIYIILIDMVQGKVHAHHRGYEILFILLVHGQLDTNSSHSRTITVKYAVFKCRYVFFCKNPTFFILLSVYLPTSIRVEKLSMSNI